ncbi:MAG: hypothetical protein FWC80_07500, partial [Firmicutes bacterium]|nr:hypothetical protein [Bacillota bacterium]
MTSYKVPVVLRSTEGIARSESDEAIPRIELFTWDCGACPELAEWVAFAPRNDNIHSVVTLTITTTNHYLLPNTGVYPMTSSKTKLTRTFILLLVAIFATATFAILPTTLTAHSAPPPPFERTVDAVPIDFGSGVFHFDVDGHEHLAVTANEIYTVSRQNQVIRYTYNAERQIDSAHSLPSTAATESITASPYGVYHLTRGGVITHIDVVSNNSNTIPVTVAPTAHITHIEAGHGTLFYVTESPHQIFNINSSTPILTSNYRISAIAPTLGPAPYYITRDTVEQVYLIHTPSGIPIERHYFYVAHHDDVLRMLFSNGNLYILSRTHLHIIRTAGTTRRVANIPLGADNLLIIDDIAVQDNNLYVLRRTLGNIRATVFRLELDSNGFPYMHGNSTLNLDVMTQLIGLSGTVLGMFNAPSSVDVGASKTIVSDTNNNRVFVAGDDGERNFVYIGGSTDSVSVAHTNRWHTPTHAAINRSGYMAISDDEGVHILRPSPNYGRITLREITGVRSLMFEGDNLYILHDTGSISRVAGPNFNTPLVTPPTIGAVRAIGAHRIYNGVVYLLYNGDFVSLETGQVVGRTTVPTSNIVGFDIDDRGVFWVLDNTRIFSEEPLDANGDPILDDFVQHIYTFSSSYAPLRASNIVLVPSEVTAFGIYIGNFVISDTLGHAIRQVDMSWLVDPDAQNGPRRYSPSDFPR